MRRRPARGAHVENGGARLGVRRGGRADAPSGIRDRDRFDDGALATSVKPAPRGPGELLREFRGALGQVGVKRPKGTNIFSVQVNKKKLQ